MSLASDLRSVMSTLRIPCEQNQYTGSEKTYLVFNIITVPTNYADDEPMAERCTVMLHLFAPVEENTTALQRDIKKLISRAGYSFPSTTPASDESGQHIVFEFEAIWPL